jgi:hypothetical protein
MKKSPFVATCLVLGLFGGAGAFADPPQKAKDKQQKKEQKSEEKAQKKEQQSERKAAKKHKHNNGKALLGDKIHANGHHVLKQEHEYTVAAEVKNGKVAGVHVKHAKKGDIKVTKYKTNKKMAMVRGTPVQVASLAPDDMQGMTITVYIGYGYYDEYDDEEELYWFPEDEVYDGDAGAIEYVEPPY